MHVFANTVSFNDQDSIAHIDIRLQGVYDECEDIEFYDYLHPVFAPENIFVLFAIHES